MTQYWLDFHISFDTFRCEFFFFIPLSKDLMKSITLARDHRTGSDFHFIRTLSGATLFGPDFTFTCTDEYGAHPGPHHSKAFPQ
jgi:hypothetical protein